MLCVLIVEGMSVVVNVMLSLMSVMSPPPALCNLSVRTAVKLCIFGVWALGVSLVFLNCDDVCMCVVYKQFELLEFVFESVYVDLQYDEISLTFVTGSHLHLRVSNVPFAAVVTPRYFGWIVFSSSVLFHTTFNDILASLFLRWKAVTCVFSGLARRLFTM